MERDDAWTVSLTRVDLSAQRAVMRYEDRSHSPVTLEMAIQPKQG